jgi:hypothetical protein
MIQRIKLISIKLVLPLLGFISLIWFLVRVIPKPSRATYPCMRAAMPLASGFVLWLTGLCIAGLSFVRARKWFRKANFFYAGILFLAGVTTLLFIQGYHFEVKASYATAYHEANQPIGEGQGIFPGRVVWIHDPDATNENCIPGSYGHGWFLNENNDQQVIEKMLSKSLRKINETSTDSLAWDRTFRFYNQRMGKGDVSYSEGEIIFIKINSTSSWYGNINLTDFSKTENEWYGISETSPQLVLAVLRELVDSVGVPQQNIYIGDPMKHIYKHCYDLWLPEFPDIHYLDYSESHGGREKVVPSSTAKIVYSDRGQVLREGTWDDASTGDPVYEDNFYKIFENMDYMINLPTLKAHKHAGITAFAKNHFGSQTRSDAKHLHNGLVAPEQYNPRRSGYGLYRVQVDIMGHALTGKKNLIYILDGLWAADYEIGEPRKFTMPPFNNDWMSSLFVSLDPVAIESVGFDFLRTEFTEERGLETYPQMEGVDDYLHQAADSVNWPEGIQYDPENDGIVIGSLGVHEHWNNAEEKLYSQNMGTADGIELIHMDNQTTSNLASETGITRNFNLRGNYPNPFNSTTKIEYNLGDPAFVTLDIFNTMGQRIRTLVSTDQPAGNQSFYWNGSDFNGNTVSSGSYFAVLKIRSANKDYSFSQKMLLIK